MEQRRRFNEDAYAYDRSRPRYVPDVFDAIDAYMPLSGICALEIGPGTGQATETVLARGAHVTAVELGSALARVMRECFAGNAALEVVNADFMEWPGAEGAFDLVYSATAFHWLPQAEALAKVKRLLRPGGVLALFWNHPAPGRSGEAAHAAVRAAYERNLGPSDKTGEFGEDRLDARVCQLRDAGFEDVKARLFHGQRHLSSYEYLDLMNTYSDHRALPDAVRAALRRDIADAIDQNGGVLNMYDTIDLYLARSQR